MLFSTPQMRRASSASLGRTSAVMISSGTPLPVTSGAPSKLTIIPSPIELNSPSLPQTPKGGQGAATPAEAEGGRAWSSGALALTATLAYDSGHGLNGTARHAARR